MVCKLEKFVMRNCSWFRSHSFNSINQYSMRRGTNGFRMLQKYFFSIIIGINLIYELFGYRVYSLLLILIKFWTQASKLKKFCSKHVCICFCFRTPSKNALNSWGNTNRVAMKKFNIQIWRRALSTIYQQ